MSLLTDIHSTCSGIALLYLGPNGQDDEYTQRLREAIDRGDLDEMEHVTAVMLGLMAGTNNPQLAFAQQQWSSAFGK